MLEPLQSQLDTITANTRALVQPERLAITDNAVQDLLATGIESRILPVGAFAPSFDLPRAQPGGFALPASLRPAGSSGELVHSTDLLAIGPLIITFFRGRWCPYCMTELEAWQRAYPAVRERGALLIAISPQLPRQNDFTAQQHKLTFPLLADAGSRIADLFGIAYTVPAAMQRHYRSILVNIPFINGTGTESHDRTRSNADDPWRLPLPATFVIAPSGRVLFAQAHADHRVRPDPLEVVAALS